MTSIPAPQSFQFQTETQQLLELMIHSLYSNKEIFLRELISNASDALDKRRFESLSDHELAPKGELAIELRADPAASTLTIRDNGIGMTRQEMIDNLGTIARSGTREYLAARRASEAAGAPDLIGQFGVGFYASFLVASRVEVTSRRAGETEATRWESKGMGTFTVAAAERDEPGTTVTLHLQGATDDEDDDDVADYTDPDVLQALVRRYSDFVAYPIRMQRERKEPVLGADGKPLAGVVPRLVQETVTLNSMQAIWARPAEEVKDSEYTEFYRHISHDWNEPLLRIATSIEGSFEAKALLFLPSRAPFDLFHREAVRRGVQLYVKRVFIMDEARELLPDYLRFVRGVVEAEDLSLNVSRELLQQDGQIRAIRRHLTKKVLDALAQLQNDARDKYTGFWSEMGPVLKEGLLEPGAPQEKLLELMMCHTTHGGGGVTTLAEYVGRMPTEQKAIYVMTAPTLETARQGPHLEAFAEKGVEVLLLADQVDDVWLRLGLKVQDHPFQSIGEGVVELGDAKERAQAAEERQELEQKHGDLLTALRVPLQEVVSQVRLSSRLAASAACLVTEAGGVSPQMERLMRQTGQKLPRIKRILELNPKHPLLGHLHGLFAKDPKDARLTRCAHLLFGQAVLAEGGQLDDPAGFARDLTEVMVQAVRDGAPT